MEILDFNMDDEKIIKAIPKKGTFDISDLSSIKLASKGVNSSEGIAEHAGIYFTLDNQTVSAYRRTSEENNLIDSIDIPYLNKGNDSWDKGITLLGSTIIVKERETAALIPALGFNQPWLIGIPEGIKLDSYNMFYTRDSIEFVDNLIITSDPYGESEVRIAVASYRASYTHGRQYFETKVLTPNESDIIRAKVILDENIPEFTHVEYRLSNDGGETSFQVEPNKIVEFPTTGSQLILSVMMYTDNIMATPKLRDINITYDTK